MFAVPVPLGSDVDRPTMAVISDIPVAPAVWVEVGSPRNVVEPSVRTVS